MIFFPAASRNVRAQLALIPAGRRGPHPGAVAEDAALVRRSSLSRGQSGWLSRYVLPQLAQLYQVTVAELVGETMPKTTNSGVNRGTHRWTAWVRSTFYGLAARTVVVRCPLCYRDHSHEWEYESGDQDPG